MTYQLLDRFRQTFEDGPYRHRKSTLGDAIALRLYEDLLDLGRSDAYAERIAAKLSVVNVKNTRLGVKARRGDGSFGEIVPNEKTLLDEGYRVPRGRIATIEIGVEVKIMSKAMIKQVDRVISDLNKQVEHFKSKRGTPICVGIVGINHAEYAVSYEADREWRTNGKKHKHPFQEAAEAERRLLKDAAPAFDEFVILRYAATNDPTPDYKFAWVDENETISGYGASLVRISQSYEQQFRKR